MRIGGYAGGAGVVLLMGLVGCSVATPSPAPGTPTASASLTVAPTNPAPSALTGQQKFVTSAAHGVRFAVPRSWTMLDLSSFADPDVRAALVPIAKELGLTVEAYVAQLTRYTDMIVTGPEVDGFSPSISVRKEEAQSLGAIPTMAKAQRDVSAVQGTVTDITTLATPVGAGYVVRYSHPDAESSATRFGAALVVPAATGTVFLVTLDAADAATRDAVIDGMASTIQRSTPA